jgi:6,7-dimethyl-8-ribityllumazine synthase
VARFNDLITRHMLWGAQQAWARLGGDPQHLAVAWVPGSMELPVTAKHLAETGDYAAVVCLGCVIRGETDHYDHVVEQSAKGIREVSTQTGIPCIFGVLTCDTVEQALNRAGVKQGNQGEKALIAGVEMANLLKQVHQGGPTRE